LKGAKMKKKTFYQVLIITFIFNLCFSSNPWAFDAKYFYGDGFSICYPSNWTLASPGQIESISKTFGFLRGNIRFMAASEIANVVVSLQPLPAEEMNIENLTDEEFECVLRKGYSRFQDMGLFDIRSIKIVRLNGLRYGEIVLDTYMFNIPIRQKQLLILKDGYGYAIAATARRNEFNYMNRQYFEPIFQSFTINR